VKYVIIGNSAAGVGGLEGIRSIDSEGEATIVSSESREAYGRPLISYLLKGSTDLERMRYRPKGFYEKNGARLAFDCVTRIDPKGKVAIGEKGEYPYDRLLIATGSSPFVPPTKGYEGVKSAHTFLTLDSALELDRAVDGKRALVVGAGLIGLKCVEGILARAASVAVVDMAGQVLPNALDQKGAAIVQRHLENMGVSFCLSDSVSEYRDGTAYLKSGACIPFDILVTAVGVRPNASLAQDAGARVERGIAVDEFLRTGLEGVYAAGDCTESIDLTDGRQKVIAILPNAYRQGYAAGRNMAGGMDRAEKAFPMNSAGFFGLHFVSAGSMEGESYTEEGEGPSYKKLVTRSNRLVGFAIVGDVARSGIYTSLIREQTDLSTIDFELLRHRPQLMAFGKASRKEMLGERV
jgi:NAD(P)H-nitrite reductase large subunit